MRKLLLLFVAVLMAALAARADVTINSTNFPDANFRAYLLSEYPSGTITTAQLNARTELILQSKGISDMTGVQYFTQLTKLQLYYNNLTSFDASPLTKLKYLNLGYNKLTSVIVNNNTALEQLYLQNNQLTVLTVYQKSALRTLWIRNNPNLTSLYCAHNNLDNLDIYNCTALQTLKCFYNPNLSTIQGLESCTALTLINCEDCAITSLNVTNLVNLENLLAARNLLTTLDAVGLSKLLNINVRGNDWLTELNCSSCDLVQLIVGGCTALNKLRCYYNDELRAITGLADCTALTYLDCEDCAITELPGVNNMTNLQRLWARNNQLTGSLNVSNLSQLNNLRVSGNTSLTGLYCSECNLIDLDVTGCTALSFLNCNYNQLTDLDLSGCTGLEDIWCRNNQLTSLDLSPCNSYNLYTLDCRYNQISSLDVGRFANLLQLACTSNQISSLQLANHTNLYNLWCGMNHLTSLDLSGCTSLETVDALDNQIASMNVSNCPNLKTMTIYYNYLTGTAMGNLIASLPTRSGETGNVYAIVDPYPDSGSTDEGNVITAAQVSQANAKNWAIYHYNWYNNSWEPIAGSSSQRGDVNGDGQVNTGDLSTLISLLLSGGNLPVSADCNLDGNKNIGDVPVLINFLLSGNWPAKAPALNAMPNSQLTLQSPTDDREIELKRPEMLKRH